MTPTEAGRSAAERSKREPTPRDERERSDLTAEMLLAMAGFDYLEVGEEATKPNGAYAMRTEGGIYIGGGR